MTHWKIPHDKRHQFLRFAPRDEIFYSWCNWFDSKKVPYEIGGGKDNWTIYKHQVFVEDFSTGRIGRCCPMDEKL